MTCDGKILILVLYILFIQILMGQQPYSSGENIIHPMFFIRSGAAYQSTGGAAIADSGLPSAAIHNPAAQSYSNLYCYIELGKRNRIIPGYSDDYDLEYDNQWIVPAFISMGKSFSRFQIALGYNNLYDYKYRMQNEVTINDYPGQGSETIISTIRRQLHAFFLSGAYSLNPNVKLGGTLGLTYLYEHDSFWDTITAKGKGYGILMIAGILYEVTPTFSIGSRIMYLSDIEYTLNNENGSLMNGFQSQEWSTQTGIFNNVNLENFNTFSGMFPEIVEVGFKDQPLNRLSIYGKLLYRNWRSISMEYVNEVNYHIGFEYTISEMVSARCGLFNEKNRMLYDFTTVNVEQNFLTAGFQMDLIDHLSLMLSYVDARWISSYRYDDSYKNKLYQIYGSAGLQYRL